MPHLQVPISVTKGVLKATPTRDGDLSTPQVALKHSQAAELPLSSSESPPLAPFLPPADPLGRSRQPYFSEEQSKARGSQGCPQAPCKAPHAQKASACSNRQQKFWDCTWHCLRCVQSEAETGLSLRRPPDLFSESPKTGGDSRVPRSSPRCWSRMPQLSISPHFQACLPILGTSSGKP